MTRRTLLDRLDDSVRWTGIPAFAEHRPRRRPLRWPSTLALALAAAGVAVMAAGGMAFRPYYVGYAMLMLGFTLGNFMKIYGPLKPWGSAERADEWDRAVRSRSYLFTFAVFAGVALAGLTLLLLGAALAWSIDIVTRAVLALFFLLATILAALPTAHASWTVRWEPAA